MKNYIGFSRDHSGSMRSIAHAAARDYNSKIESVKSASLREGQDTVVSVVECGHGRGADTKMVVTNSAVTALQPIPERGYIANGSGTPLWDSVGDLITLFEKVPDYKDPNVSFLVMAITDGAENASYRWNARTLGAKIRELNDTDRWSFIFRVPRGHSSRLASLGIPAGNILEWDQTEKGVATAAKQDAEAFTEYFSGRTRGVTSTQKFYTDLSNVTSTDVAAVLTDVSAEVTIWPVTVHAEIKPFVEARSPSGQLERGSAYYQLTKKEDEVQDNKKILVRDKTTQAVYYGPAARQMLGLTGYGTVKVVPGNHGNWDVFLQSTSVNRKLMPGTSVVYWPAGVTK